jgi:hypothetical protein
MADKSKSTKPKPLKAEDGGKAKPKKPKAPVGVPEDKKAAVRQLARAYAERARAKKTADELERLTKQVHGAGVAVDAMELALEQK